MFPPAVFHLLGKCASLHYKATSSDITVQIIKTVTCHFEVSKYVCAGLHLHGAADEGAVGGVAVVAPAAPPPSTGELWLRSVGSKSQSVSALPGTSESLWSVVDPPVGPLLHKGQNTFQVTHQNSCSELVTQCI